MQNTHSPYTPTTEEIRELVQGASAEEFDRWVAEVKAEAWEEGYAHGNADAFTEARLDRDNPYRQGEGQ